MMSPDLRRITVTEAAVIASTDPATLKQAFGRGELPYVLLGRRRVIRTTPAWLRAWQLRSAEGGPPRAH